jgi:hypothetical protein
MGEVPAAVTAQNLANWVATGVARGEDLEFRMVTKPALASLIASRRMRATSLLLGKASWSMNREGFDLARGDVVKLSWPAFGIAEIAMRIASVDYGNGDDRTIKIDAVEDVFAVADAVYVAPPPTNWTTPSLGSIDDS